MIFMNIEFEFAWFEFVRFKTQYNHSRQINGRETFFSDLSHSRRLCTTFIQS